MTNVNPPAPDSETLEFLEIFLEQVSAVNVEFSTAERNRSLPALQNVSRVIHTIKGSAGSCGFDFAPVICHNIEEALNHIKESGFTPPYVDVTTSLLSILEDYFTAKKKNFFADDDDFAVRMYASFNTMDGDAHKHTLAGLRGLIVEDSKIVSKKIADKLLELGVHCSHSGNGLEALNRLTDEYFDFVVTGQNIKKINGFELLEILKISKGKNPQLRTCLITSAENLTPFKKTGHLVLQKNSSLTSNLISFLKQEFEVKHEVKKLKSFKKILLVDDDPVIRKLLQAVFSKETQLQVEIAASGGEALNKVQTFSPEIVVLDVIMPGLSGAETFKALKVLNQLKSTQFFFLTGKTRPEEIEELLSLGAHGVLAKPFAPERLLTSLLEKYNATA